VDQRLHDTPRLASLCQTLGLPEPPAQSEGSKFERASASFAALPDTALPLLAERALAAGSLTPADRNSVQDVLWAAADRPVVPKRTRREIAQNIDLEDLIHDARRFTQLLDSLWVLDDQEGLASLLTGNRSLRDNIEHYSELPLDREEK
jgi:hypothetical protein